MKRPIDGKSCAVKVVRKVDPATRAKRLQPIYRKLVTKGASKSALLTTLAGDNRHRRWSVRILMKMRLIEAVPEEPKAKPVRKAKTAKPKPTVKATADPTVAKVA